MPRPRIMKHVDGMPKFERFGPLGYQHDLDIIIMSIEEYETIRLIDQIGLNQAECAKQMKIGRTTAQRIYNDARKKLAECIIHGRTLQFEGGDYFIRGNGHGRGRGRNKGYRGRNG